MKRSIDTNATPEDRKKGLVSICNDVLQQVLPEPEKTNEREWATVFFMYLMWWEGDRATARTQGGGGPGRGLIQLEAGTMWDLYNHYSRVLSGAEKKKFLDRCTWALMLQTDDPATVQASLSAALEDFWNVNKPQAADKPPKNTWPNTGTAASVETWVKEVDSLAIMLMYLQLTRGTSRKIPPSDLANLSKNARNDSFKEEHSEAWAAQWKKKFEDDAERKKLKGDFQTRARDLDQVQ